MSLRKRLSLCVVMCSFAPLSIAASPKLAPVAGFARSFLMGAKLSGGTVTILETGKKIQTDSNGHFGPILYPVGKPLTLEFEKWGYKTTQTSTVIVPPEGLAGPYDNLTFQVPSIESYYLLSKIIGAKIDDDSCHVTTTITAYHKTLDDVPQGESSAIVTLTPSVNETPIYFGIYESGPLKGKTNPFERGLTRTTEDGGAAYFNLPPRDEPYVISAYKKDVKFSEASFMCRKGSFINISPPRGPMAQVFHVEQI